jgi:hypothetical protein
VTDLAGAEEQVSVVSKSSTDHLERRQEACEDHGRCSLRSDCFCSANLKQRSTVQGRQPCSELGMHCNRAAQPYLDIVVEDEMALAVLGKQVKSIVVGKVFELSKGTYISD